MIFRQFNENLNIYDNHVKTLLKYNFFVHIINQITKKIKHFIQKN